MKTRQLTLTAMMTAFIFVATFVPKIPIPLGYARAFGRRGDFSDSNVLRTACRNIERRNRLGIGGFFKRLSDLDSADNFNQGGGGRNFLATAREKFFTRTDFGKFGDDGGLYAGRSIFI